MYPLLGRQACLRSPLDLPHPRCTRMPSSRTMTVRLLALDRDGTTLALQVPLFPALVATQPTTRLPPWRNLHPRSVSAVTTDGLLVARRLHPQSRTLGDQFLRPVVLLKLPHRQTQMMNRLSTCFTLALCHARRSRRMPRPRMRMMSTSSLQVLKGGDDTGRLSDPCTVAVLYILYSEPCILYILVHMTASSNFWASKTCRWT